MMKKIEISKVELSRVLSEGGSFAGRSKIMPILDCICVATRDGRIRVSSTDNKNHIKSYGLCEKADDVIFCVVAKDFISYVSSICDDIIVMKYNEEKSTLHISHSNGKIKFSTYASDESPASPVVKDAYEVELPSSFFARWLSVASNFAQKTDAGSVLEGVNVRVEDGKLYVFGSDRNSIFIGMMPTVGIADFDMTILPTGISVLSKIVKNRDTIKLQWNDDRLTISGDNVIMCTALFALKYPNLCKYMQLRGNDYFEIENDKLLASCKRIKTQLCGDYTNLRISHNAGILSLRYESPEYNKELQEDIVVDCYDFDEVGVNINRLVAVLTSCATPMIRFYHSNNAKQPIFIESDFGDYKEIFGLSPMV